MPWRRICQEMFGFEKRETVTALDELSSLIDWGPIGAALEALPVARRREGRMASVGTLSGAADRGLA